MINIRNGLIVIIGGGVLALIVSCGSSSSGGGATAAATVVRSADLTGGAENPPVVTAATGRGAVVVNPTTMEITGGITFSGLTQSMGGTTSTRLQSGTRRRMAPSLSTCFWQATA